MSEFDEMFKTSPKPGNAAKYVCHKALQKDIDVLKTKVPFPEPSDEEKVGLFLRKLNELRRSRRSVQLFLDICVRCGACVKQCHYYLGTEDPKNAPVGRAEILRKIYRRYFTIGGKLFGKLAGAEDLTPEYLEKELYTYFYQCTECRRCSVFCPYGIDTAEITMAAREALEEAGLATKYITEVIAKVHTIGNNLGIPKPALENTLEFVKDDIKDMYGVDVEIPLDKEKADILFVAPSADFFTNVDTLIGYILVLNKLGLDWTFSSYASEIANFGLFFSYREMEAIAARIIRVARQIGAKWVIAGECGHACRAARQFWEQLNGPLPFKFMNVGEFTASMIRKGRLRFDPSKNADVKATLHDPCNYARAGNLVDEYRFILKHVLPEGNFIDMREDAIKVKTFCCGGGGGLLTDEIMELRMLGGKPKAMAVKEVVEKHGVNYLAAPCAIDKAQLPLVMQHWNVPVQVGGVHDLVAKALKWE